MNLFGKRHPLTDARAAGELLALRVAMSVLLEAIGGDFPFISKGLASLRDAALTTARAEGLPAPTIEGFDAFMLSFIAAARRNE